MVQLKKLFISHASEDKDAIARPLADALIKAGYRVWFDEYSLQLGDSLKLNIDKGLASCDFGIVILTPSFFSKPWPKEELDGLAAVETWRHQKVILPIWHDISFDDIVAFSPTLAGKLAIKSSVGITNIVEAITRSVNDAEAFVSRRDLDRRTIHFITAAAEPVSFNMAKLPEVTWEAFGKQLLKEMRRLDEEQRQSQNEA
jgi:hypothetical protein